jgi:hypothetical protein
LLTGIHIAKMVYHSMFKFFSNGKKEGGGS